MGKVTPKNPQPRNVFRKKMKGKGANTQKALARKSLGVARGREIREYFRNKKSVFG